MCQMALWIQIDQERPNPHLGKAETIRGRDRALPRPPFKVEEELFPDGFEEGRKSQVGSILADILRLIIPFLVGIPFGRRKGSFGLLLNEFVF